MNQERGTTDPTAQVAIGATMALTGLIAALVRKSW